MLGVILGFIGGVVGLVVTVVAVGFMFETARQFVRRRLRFVDGVYNPVVPWVAAGVTLLIAMPVVALLPAVGATTGFAVAAATGLGTASGVRALKRGE